VFPLHNQSVRKWAFNFVAEPAMNRIVNQPVVHSRKLHGDCDKCCMYPYVLTPTAAPASCSHLAQTDYRNHGQDGSSDTNLGGRTELWAFVSGVAWMAARPLRCICARFQRGVERIDGIVHDVHGGEGQERCVEVKADLAQDGFSGSQGVMAQRVLPLSGASRYEDRSSCLSYPVPQPLRRRVCRPLLEAKS
jgi:hypothetical protein